MDKKNYTFRKKHLNKDPISYNTVAHFFFIEYLNQTTKNIISKGQNYNSDEFYEDLIHLSEIFYINKSKKEIYLKTYKANDFFNFLNNSINSIVNEESLIAKRLFASLDFFDKTNEEKRVIVRYLIGKDSSVKEVFMMITFGCKIEFYNLWFESECLYVYLEAACLISSALHENN